MITMKFLVHLSISRSTKIPQSSKIVKVIDAGHCGKDGGISQTY